MDPTKNRLRGCLIRQLRTDRGLSLENMARILNMNASILCDMELGKRRISDEMIQSILKQLNTDFVLVNDGVVSSLSQTIQRYFQNHYYMDFASNLPIEEEYRELANKRSDSFDDGSFYGVLLGCFIAISHETSGNSSWNDPDLDHKLELLDAVDEYFPTPLNSISKLIRLHHALYLRDLKRAGSLIRQMQTDYSDPVNSQVITLVKYLDLKLANEQYDTSRAYQLIPIIRSELIKDKNYRRLFNLDQLEAIYFMLTGNYMQAEKSLSDLQTSLLSIDPTIEQKTILENRIWCALMTRRFAECLDLIAQREAICPVDSGSNAIFRPYCQYRLNPDTDHRQQEEELLALRKICAGDKNSQKGIDVLLELVKGRKKTFFSKCLSFINQLFRQQHYQVADFFIQAGFDEAEKQNLYDVMYQFEKLHQAIDNISS